MDSSFLATSNCQYPQNFSQHVVTQVFFSHPDGPCPPPTGLCIHCSLFLEHSLSTLPEQPPINPPPSPGNTGRLKLSQVSQAFCHTLSQHLVLVLQTHRCHVVIRVINDCLSCYPGSIRPEFGAGGHGRGPTVPEGTKDHDLSLGVWAPSARVL